jgi:hypothetical protein
MHNKLQAFLKLLEFRVVGSAGGRREGRVGRRAGGGRGGEQPLLGVCVC